MHLNWLIILVSGKTGLGEWIMMREVVRYLGNASLKINFNMNLMSFHSGIEWTWKPAEESFVP